MAINKNLKDNEFNGKDARVMVSFLDTALDIEDQMGGEVYAEFLNRDIWPVNLKDDLFSTIEELLTVLIKETAEHKKEFLNLKNKLNNAPKKN